MGEIDEIKKLSPEERIKRLKELEESRKKEIKEAEDMIKRSEEELEDIEKEKFDIPVPQMKAVSVDQLFTEEEKQIFEAKRGIKRKSKQASAEKGKLAPEKETNLEEQVWKEAPQHQRLAQELSERSPQELYKAAINTIKEASEDGRELSEQEKDYLQGIKYATIEHERNIAHGYETATKQMLDKLGSTESIIQKYLRG